jgi:hypothetical protein
VFVTNDEGQSKALRSIGEMIGRETDVLLYPDFKARLLGIGVGAR